MRIPAACSGIFAIKATTGRVARDSSTSLTGDYLAHEGPLARTVTDAALLLDVMSGPDSRDRFSQLGAPPAFAANLDRFPHALRIAWSPDLGFIDVDREYLDLCRTAALDFQRLGASVDQASPEDAGLGRQVWNVVAPACTYAPTRIAELRQNPDLLTETVRSDLDFAERTTLAGYFDAVQGLRKWRAAASQFFDRFDLLLTPALPLPPPTVLATSLEIGGKSHQGTAGLMDFTAPFNATGQPAAVVPSGFTAAGLPVALQIVGRFGEDLLVMQAAKAFEQLRPWADRWPALAGADRET